VILNAFGKLHLRRVEHSSISSTYIDENSKGSDGSNRASDNISSIDRARFAVGASAAVAALLSASLTRAFLVAVKATSIVAVIIIVVAALTRGCFVAFRNGGNGEFLAVRVYAENTDGNVLANVDGLGDRADKLG
jgi:hypothetical protein